MLTVDDISAVRDPVPAICSTTVQAGARRRQRRGRRCSARRQLLDKDGEPIDTNGAPALGVSWSDDPELNGVTLKDGAAAGGPDEVVIDKLTADNNDYEVGDEITIVFDNGPATFRIVGLVGLGDTDGFGGATRRRRSHRRVRAADPRRRRHVRRDRHPRRRGRRRRRPCKAADRGRAAAAHRGRHRRAGRRGGIRLDQRDHLDLRHRAC